MPYYPKYGKTLEFMSMVLLLSIILSLYLIPRSLADPTDKGGSGPTPQQPEFGYNPSNPMFLCDPAHVKGKSNVILGNNLSQTIKGTDKDNIILGQGGDDKIFGNGGNDIICGGLEMAAYMEMQIPTEVAAITFWTEMKDRTDSMEAMGSIKCMVAKIMIASMVMGSKSR